MAARADSAILLRRPQNDKEGHAGEDANHSGFSCGLLATL